MKAESFFCRYLTLSENSKFIVWILSGSNHRFDQLRPGLGQRPLELSNQVLGRLDARARYAHPFRQAHPIDRGLRQADQPPRLRADFLRARPHQFDPEDAITAIVE